MLFYKPHLREYLLSKERGNERQERCQSTTATEDLQTPLVLQVIEASQLKPRPAKQYVNLCDPESGLVYAQIHPNSRAGDLVIPEPDQELPECQHLERVETEDFESLAGYYGPNRDWMLGNGKRFTTKPAAVFHIPPAAQTDPNHGAWREIQALIKYAKNRRERRRST
jgi:hypothetical protein